MPTRARIRPAAPPSPIVGEYRKVLASVVELLEAARRASARSVNAVMTATYWEVGRRIVEFEQRGRLRAAYGEYTTTRLSADLTHRFGRGFSRRNVEQMRLFYLNWPDSRSSPAALTPARASRARSKAQTPSAQSSLVTLSSRFPLPWSHYVRLLSVENPEARAFYEQEALRGGWSVRQLDRQVSTLFYERTAMSLRASTVLRKGARSRAGDAVSPEEEIKDPYILEFLDLKDEYSESDVEASLVRGLEAFLMELGGDFAFVGRQRRLRIDDEWYRIDLLFFHRRLRCLIIIDLKLGRLTHADAGQMHLYLNYARHNWTLPDENPPIGLILCASKGHAMAKYALEGLPNRVLAAEYRTALPSERELVAAIERTRRSIERRSAKALPAARPRRRR